MDNISTCVFKNFLEFVVQVLDVPLTVKIRTGVQQNCNIAHKLIPELKKWGVSMITVCINPHHPNTKKRQKQMRWLFTSAAPGCGCFLYSDVEGDGYLDIVGDH